MWRDVMIWIPREKSLSFPGIEFLKDNAPLASNLATVVIGNVVPSKALNVSERISTFVIARKVSFLRLLSRNLLDWRYPSKFLPPTAQVFDVALQVCSLRKLLVANGTSYFRHFSSHALQSEM
eukprot:TRINITY_DN5894_c0_g1_i1.p1 TRINITY_DN5894_c0_g1~~TRINITY_DN5894_c0_g1_i1.p1  ORF type:complete len:123 (+),score=5.76 TRINITY_DN5894_c0_g1_i1:37-405(+)